MNGWGWAALFVVATVVLVSIWPVSNCVMTGEVGHGVSIGIAFLTGKGASQIEPVLCPGFIPQFAVGTPEWENANWLITTAYLIFFPLVFCVVFGVVIFVAIRDEIEDSRKRKEKEEKKNG